MMKRILSFFSETRWKYKLRHSNVRIRKNAVCSIGNAIIDHSVVYVENGTLLIEDGCELRHVNLYVRDGNVHIRNNTSITGASEMSITVEHGSVSIGHHSKLSCKRIWVRFGGKVVIGNYTNINSGSEIRSDESVLIGNYNQISFNVNVWDTNTHNVYEPQKRRELTERYWPYFGKEVEKPVTGPVVIGDDCWIGENVSILKGSTLGNEVTVGLGTIIAGKEIASGKKVVSSIDLRIL